MKYTKGQSKGKDMLAFWPNSLDGVNMQLVNASDSLPECALRYSYRQKDGWALVDISDLKNISDYAGEIRNIKEVLNVAQTCLLQGWCVPLIKDTLFVSEDRQLKIIALPYMEQAPGGIDDLKAILSSRDEFDCFKADSEADIHQFEANGKRVKKNSAEAGGFGMDFFGRSQGGLFGGGMAVDFFGRPVESAPKEDVVDFFGFGAEKEKTDASGAQNDGFMDMFFQGGQDDKSAEPQSDDDAFFGLGSFDAFDISAISKSSAQNEQIPSNGENGQSSPVQETPMDAFFGFGGLTEENDNPAGNVNDVPQSGMSGFFGGFIQDEPEKPNEPANQTYQDPFMQAFMGNGAQNTSANNESEPAFFMTPAAPKKEEKQETVVSDPFAAFAAFEPVTETDAPQEENSGFGFFSAHTDQQETDPAVQKFNAPDAADIMSQKQPEPKNAEEAIPNNDQAEAFDFFSGFGMPEFAQSEPEIKSLAQNEEAIEEFGEAPISDEAIQEDAGAGFDFFGGVFAMDDQNSADEKQEDEITQPLDASEEADNGAVEEETDAFTEPTDDSAPFGMDFFAAWSDEEKTAENEQTAVEELEETDVKEEIESTETTDVDFFASWDSEESEAVEEVAEEEPAEAVEETFDELDETVASEASALDFFAAWDMEESEVVEEVAEETAEAVKETSDELDETVSSEASAIDFFANWDSEESEVVEEVEEEPAEAVEETSDELDETVSSEASAVDFFASWDSEESEMVEEVAEETAEAVEEASDELDETVSSEASAVDFFAGWDSEESEMVEEVAEETAEAVNETSDELDETVSSEASAIDFFANWDSEESEVVEEVEEEPAEAVEETSDELDETVSSEASALDFFAGWDSEESEMVEEVAEEEPAEAVEETSDELDETVSSEASALDFFAGWDSEESEMVEEVEEEEPAEAVEETSDELDETVSSEASAIDFFASWDSEESEMVEEVAEEEPAEAVEETSDELDETVSSEASAIDFFASWGSEAIKEPTEAEEESEAIENEETAETGKSEADEVSDEEYDDAYVEITDMEFFGGWSLPEEEDEEEKPIEEEQAEEVTPENGENELTEATNSDFFDGWVSTEEAVTLEETDKAEAQVKEISDEREEDEPSVTPDFDSFENWDSPKQEVSDEETTEAVDFPADPQEELPVDEDMDVTDQQDSSGTMDSDGISDWGMDPIGSENSETASIQGESGFDFFGEMMNPALVEEAPEPAAPEVESNASVKMDADAEISVVDRFFDEWKQSGEDSENEIPITPDIEKEESSNDEMAFFVSEDIPGGETEETANDGYESDYLGSVTDEDFFRIEAGQNSVPDEADEKQTPDSDKVSAENEYRDEAGHEEAEAFDEMPVEENPDQANTFEEPCYDSEIMEDSCENAEEPYGQADTALDIEAPGLSEADDKSEMEKPENESPVTHAAEDKQEAKEELEFVRYNQEQDEISEAEENDSGFDVLDAWGLIWDSEEEPIVNGADDEASSNLNANNEENSPAEDEEKTVGTEKTFSEKLAAFSDMINDKVMSNIANAKSEKLDDTITISDNKPSLVDKILGGGIEVAFGEETQSDQEDAEDFDLFSLFDEDERSGEAEPQKDAEENQKSEEAFKKPAFFDRISKMLQTDEKIEPNQNGSRKNNESHKQNAFEESKPEPVSFTGDENDETIDEDEGFFDMWDFGDDETN